MAKNLAGDRQVASANRLTDGAVVFLDDAGQWVGEIAHAALADDPRGAELLLARARAEAASVVDPYLVAIDESGAPLSLRERIRVSGLTFQAIAAEAVRYA